MFLAMLDGILFHTSMSDRKNRSNMTETNVLNLQDFELVMYYDL